MSGQWEVVGKKKDKNNKLQPQKAGNKEKQKLPIKVEDVLPQSQIKNLFTAKNGKDKPQEKAKDKKGEQQQKKPQKKQEKQELSPKLKQPKSIESALNMINVDEFKSLYEKTKVLYPDGPIIWLKELAQFLNQKIPIDVSDPVFKNKADCYPYSVIPSQIRNVMEKAVKDAGRENTQIFFDICVTTMATDMTKGLSAIGHKLFIQLMVLSDPAIVATNLIKHAGLKNSYQNRPHIGLSILWALGQGGIKDFNTGFKVFQEIMYPLMELKNYSKYVATYLVDLVNRFNDVPLKKEQYQFIMEIIYSNKKNFPNDVSIQKIVPKLKLLLFINTNEKYHNIVEFMLKKMMNVDSDQYRRELSDIVISCLQKDQTTFGTWGKNYAKHLTSSSFLLNYMDEKWPGIQKKFNRKAINDVLNTIESINEDLATKKKKDEGLVEAVAAVERIRSKMVRKSKSMFPYKTLAFATAVVFAAVLIVDLKKSGSWEQSATYKKFERFGVNDYAARVKDRVHDSFVWATARFDEKFPGYSEKIAEYSGPYVQLTREMGWFFYNVFDGVREKVVEVYPILIERVEHFAPGVMEQSSKTVQNVWTSSVFYINRSVDYLKTEVFVGNLAPENVQRIVVNAMNTTQQKASEYYNWLYEKVQNTIK